MIYITQGHENGIGLEVFFKALPEFSLSELNQLHLFADKNSIEQHLSFITNDFVIKNKQIIFAQKTINYTPLPASKYSQTLTAMLLALEHIKSQDILFTLPTSKDQLYYQQQNFAGHTEFLRYFFNNQLLTMSFWGPSHNQLLLTDHVPLAEVTKVISPEYFFKKLHLGIKNYLKYFPDTQHIYLAGINPHAGEEGLLGSEEQQLANQLTELQLIYPQLSNFIPGDTLHTYSSNKALFIYIYHDQGLSRFKSENHFIGINATLGLPFLRVSVDHGTAFSLYGKNSADPAGVIYTLKKVLKL